MIRDFNEPPVVVRQLDSVSSFKNYLNREFVTVPKYYLTGKRNLQILDTRLRTCCSSLNDDLFLKSYLTLHYGVVVALKTLNISSLDAIETTNTEHCSLTKFPSTSQFLLICYFMEIVHFRMKPKSSYFKRYFRTYQILSLLMCSHLLTYNGNGPQTDKKSQNKNKGL